MRPRTTRPYAPAMEAAASQARPEPGEDGRTLVQVIGRIAVGGPITAVDLKSRTQAALLAQQEGLIRRTDPGAES